MLLSSTTLVSVELSRVQTNHLKIRKKISNNKKKFFSKKVYIYLTMSTRVALTREFRVAQAQFVPTNNAKMRVFIVKTLVSGIANFTKLWEWILRVILLNLRIMCETYFFSIYTILRAQSNSYRYTGIILPCNWHEDPNTVRLLCRFHPQVQLRIIHNISN